MSRLRRSRSLEGRLILALTAGPLWACFAPAVGGSLPLFQSPPSTQDKHTHDHPNETPPSTQAVAEANLRATLSHDYYAPGTPERLVLKIDIAAPSAPASESEPARPPLNLALLIDRSGSMAAKGKFEYASRAVALVVENLSDRDVFSLIAFNENSVVLSPAGRVVNKGFLRHRLSELEPEGWTNLSAGFLDAVSQISSSSAEGQSKRIILLTDGLANRGVTNAERLRDMVESAKTRGIAVSTMGVGADFDQKLLSSLAEAGGGRYVYIRDAEEIPGAMQAELSGLLAVTAQNARLKIASTGGARIARVFGRTLDSPTDRFSIDLSDLRDGERGSFVMELMSGKLEEGAASGAEVTLTMDLPAGARRISQTASASAEFTSDRDKVRSSERQAVTLTAAILVALEKAEQAAAGLDKERLGEVSALFKSLHEQARRVALESRDQDLLNDAFMLEHLMEELSAAAQAGLMHDHDDAGRRLGKGLAYERYLLEHHGRPR